MKKKKSKLSVKGGKGKAGKGKKRNRSANSSRSANASAYSSASDSEAEPSREGGTSGLSELETELEDKTDSRGGSAERGVISRQSRTKVLFLFFSNLVAPPLPLFPFCFARSR